MSEPNPVVEWNRLHKINAENAIVGGLLESMLAPRGPIDKFSTWLLVGEAAIGSFLITNADKIIPMFGKPGFGWAGIFISASCIFGLVQKVYAMRADAVAKSRKLSESKIKKALEEFERTRVLIDEAARKAGIEISTDLPLAQVLASFSQQLPWWLKLIFAKKINRAKTEPHLALSMLLGLVFKQSYCLALQCLGFLAFMASSFYFIATMK